MQYHTIVKILVLLVHAFPKVFTLKSAFWIFTLDLNLYKVSSFASAPTAAASDSTTSRTPSSGSSYW